MQSSEVYSIRYVGGYETLYLPSKRTTILYIHVLGTDGVLPIRTPLLGNRYDATMGVVRSKLVGRGRNSWFTISSPTRTKD